MKEATHHRLLKRGWLPHEAQRVKDVFESAKNLRSKYVQAVDKIVYLWIFLIALIANLCVGVVLVPAMITLSGIWLYFVVVVLGLMFGATIGLVIRHLEIKEKHHFVIGVINSLFALVIFFLFTGFANKIASGFIKNVKASSCHNGSSSDM